MKLSTMMLICAVPIIVALSPALAALDPTKPAVGVSSMPSETSTADGEFTLQSIFSRSDSFSAIISGKSYREGDTIGEYTISRINSKDVVITDGRQQKTLRMYEYEIKK